MHFPLCLVPGFILAKTAALAEGLMVMEWLILLGGVFLAHHLDKTSPTTPRPSPVKTIRSVRKAYKNNLWMINRLPLAPEERDAAREAARQKMLRELEDLMS